MTLTESSAAIPHSHNPAPASSNPHAHSDSTPTPSGETGTVPVDFAASKNHPDYRYISRAQYKVLLDEITRPTIIRLDDDALQASERSASPQLDNSINYTCISPIGVRSVGDRSTFDVTNGTIDEHDNSLLMFDEVKSSSFSSQHSSTNALSSKCKIVPSDVPLLPDLVDIVIDYLRYSVGDHVDVLDTCNKWYESEIVDICTYGHGLDADTWQQYEGKRAVTGRPVLPLSVPSPSASPSSSTSSSTTSTVNSTAAPTSASTAHMPTSHSSSQSKNDECKSVSNLYDYANCRCHLHARIDTSLPNPSLASASSSSSSEAASHDPEHDNHYMTPEVQRSNADTLFSLRSIMGHGQSASSTPSSPLTSSTSTTTNQVSHSSLQTHAHPHTHSAARTEGKDNGKDTKQCVSQYQAQPARLLVRFLGWDVRWNEWIEEESDRLAPLRSHTDMVHTHRCRRCPAGPTLCRCVSCRLTFGS